MASHAEWTGLVQPLLINRYYAYSSVDKCAAVTAIPILQDDAAGTLAKALGTTGGGVFIVDAQGVLLYKNAAGSFPAVTAAVEATVTESLGL